MLQEKNLTPKSTPLSLVIQALQTNAYFANVMTGPKTSAKRPTVQVPGATRWPHPRFLCHSTKLNPMTHQPSAAP